MERGGGSWRVPLVALRPTAEMGAQFCHISQPLSGFPSASEVRQSPRGAFSKYHGEVDPCGISGGPWRILSYAGQKDKSGYPTDSGRRLLQDPPRHSSCIHALLREDPGSRLSKAVVKEVWLFGDWPPPAPEG